jgi:hypothetical protein
MEWEWNKAEQTSLAKFITEDSIKLLDKLPVDDRLKLIQDDDGRRDLVKVIYNTLVSKDIKYAYEKYDPEAEKQQIRTPSEILGTPGEGTCLDLAILFCGLCFGYDLLPLLIVIEGHALAAVSLNHKRDQWEDLGRERTLFNKRDLFKGEENLAELQKLIENNAYIAVECTGFAHTNSFGNSEEPEAIGRTANGVLSFEKAVSAGRKQLSNPNRPFQFAIDAATAQYCWKIKPLEIPNLAAELRKVEVNQKAEKLKETEMEGVNAKGKATTGEFTVNQIVGEAEKSKMTGWRGDV